MGSFVLFISLFFYKCEPRFFGVGGQIATPTEDPDMKSILYVESELSIIEMNRKFLEYSGYTVLTANTLAQARKHLSKQMPDAIVLEMRLSDGLGLDLLKELREEGNPVPVLLLTAQNKPNDIVCGIRAGANDCIYTPVEYEVLLAKIEAMFRNVQCVPLRVTCGALSLDILSMQAFINKVNIMVNPKEFALLLLFVQNENKVMSAEYLYEKVWGTPMLGNRNSLQTMVSRLRRKIESTGYFIDSSYGNGYAFSAAHGMK